jgi:hypothetical protein
MELCTTSVENPDLEAGDDQPVCYVCLAPGGELLQPCACTWLHVHEACLVRMVETSGARRTCTICKTTFRNVACVTENVQRIDRQAAVLVSCLIVGALICAGAWLYSLNLRVFGGDEDANTPLILLSCVFFACVAVAWYAERAHPVLRAETRTRAVVALR